MIFQDTDIIKISSIAVKLKELEYGASSTDPDAVSSYLAKTAQRTLWAGWFGFSTNKAALAWASPIEASKDTVKQELIDRQDDGTLSEDLWTFDGTINDAVEYVCLYARVVLRLKAVDDKEAGTFDAPASQEVKTATTSTSPTGVDYLATGTASEKDAYTDLEKVDVADQATGAIPRVVGDDYDTDFFTANVKVFVEGVEVPFNQCSVSYGINSAATCTIVIPAHRLLRQLPESTRLHVIFQDPIKINGVNEWRLLFDGELAGYQYRITPTGASMILQGLHSVSYLEQLQLIFTDIANYMYDPTPQMLGEACFVTKAGFNKIDINIIENLVSRKDTFKSMADIVYLLLYNIIYGANISTGTKKTVRSPVGDFIFNKLGSMWDGSKDVAGSWKILKRIYGVSDEAHKAALINKWVTVKQYGTAYCYPVSGTSPTYLTYYGYDTL